MDCSVLGIHDGFSFQETDHIYPPLHYSSSGSHPVEILQSLPSDLEKQRVELDLFLQLESKRLRRLVIEEEARKQAVIMEKWESRIKNLMMQKDEEIALARKRTRELQGWVRGAEMESREWEKAAKEREAIVADLKHMLSEAKERERGDDAVSFCESCEIGRSCVVLLPCMHLCCCNLCEPLLPLCPLCHTLKNATLQVLFA